MRMVLRMKLHHFVLAAEIPCEWKFANKFASDCECDGLVHSVWEREVAVFCKGRGLCKDRKTSDKKKKTKLQTYKHGLEP